VKSLLLAIWFVLFGFAVVSAQTDRIKKTLVDYSVALKNLKGKKAASLVDSATIAFYDNLRMLSLYATQEELATHSLLDRLTILSIRIAMSANDLEKMEGKVFFARMIDNGLGSNIFSDYLASIQVDGNTAMGYLESIEDRDSPHFVFNKENGQWKINLVSHLPIINMLLVSIQSGSGRNENDFMLFRLKQPNGEKADNSIWEPLLIK
jgi:hypothetical protein